MGRVPGRPGRPRCGPAPTGVRMSCPQCHAPIPEVAHDGRGCRGDARSADESRQRHWAGKAEEPVASFALVSTIMPRGAGERGRTYQITLGVALVAALLAA